ncbi:MAG: S-layer homology domain-containing protein, partial [Firmicutes bacterium]|nr:S-layer homology domain-containing protein [Bacillota bacterium]
VAEVNQAGWMVGRSETKFAPYASMTRKEYVCLVGRLAGLSDAEFEAYGKINFADVEYNSSNKWYTKYLAWALKNEVMVGEERNGKLYFNPDANITREQICAVLVRLSDKVNGDISPIESAITFADAKDISPWAKDSVYTAQRAGLIYGSLDYGKLFMNPQDNASRAEVAAIFLRFTRRMPIL